MRRVALVGVNNAFGADLLDEFEVSGQFKVDIFARAPSKVTPRAGFALVKFDWTDHAALVKSLRGVETVLVTFGTADPSAADTQKALIDAAIEAGVKRYIPSEFAGDLSHPLSKRVPIYGTRYKVLDYLHTKVEEGAITSTVFFAGAFLEFGLQTGFLGYNFKSKTAIIQEDGNIPFSVSSSRTVARAILGALNYFDETKNKLIRIHDGVTTQNELLNLIERISGEKWKVEHVSTQGSRDVAMEKLQRGEVDFEVIRSLILSTVYVKDGAATWVKPDNELIGLRTVRVEETVAKVVKVVSN